MGFGILFIGYLFLLNLSFYAYTDLLSGVLILYALEKLRKYNRGFRYAFFLTIPFAAAGACELVFKILSLFSVSIAQQIGCAVSAFRMLALCPMHIGLFLGFKQITAEVGLTKMASRAEALIPLSPLLHIFQALLELPSVFASVGEQTLLTVRFIVLLGALVYTAAIAVFIYRSYARICLPEDADMRQRPSRFAFVNEYRARQEQKQKEEIDARICEMRKKHQQRKKKKKK